MVDHFHPINFDKYEQIVTAAIKRKHGKVATKEDIALVELFDIAYNQAMLNEQLTERLANYYVFADKDTSRQLTFLQGHCWDNELIKSILMPYIESSKFTGE